MVTAAPDGLAELSNSFFGIGAVAVYSPRNSIRLFDTAMMFFQGDWPAEKVEDARKKYLYSKLYDLEDIRIDYIAAVDCIGSPAASKDTYHDYISRIVDGFLQGDEKRIETVERYLGKEGKQYPAREFIWAAKNLEYEYAVWSRYPIAQAEIEHARDYSYTTIKIAPFSVSEQVKPGSANAHIIFAKSYTDLNPRFMKVNIYAPGRSSSDHDFFTTPTVKQLEDTFGAYSGKYSANELIYEIPTFGILSRILADDTTNPEFSDVKISTARRNEHLNETDIRYRRAGIQDVNKYDAVVLNAPNGKERIVLEMGNYSIFRDVNLINYNRRLEITAYSPSFVMTALDMFTDKTGIFK